MSFSYSSETSFEIYAKQCLRVFGNNGLLGITWTIAAVFRDFIWAEQDSFPLLFLQGQKETGKSQLAWALSDIFFKKHGPFMLKSGTDAGFAGRMETFQNTVSWMDEYENDIDRRLKERLMELKMSIIPPAAIPPTADITRGFSRSIQPSKGLSERETHRIAGGPPMRKHSEQARTFK